MTLTLAGKKIAVLVANGFDENQMAEIQRALTKAKAVIKTIAPEQGVVNGWQGEGWGHYFPVDVQINEALGSDFDMLVVPGGERGAEKLKGSLHTRRIIGHFLEAGKPIAAIGAGVRPSRAVEQDFRPHGCGTCRCSGRAESGGSRPERRAAGSGFESTDLRRR